VIELLKVQKFYCIQILPAQLLVLKNVQLIDFVEFFDATGKKSKVYKGGGRTLGYIKFDQRSLLS